jgi:hypothetical protein
MLRAFLGTVAGLAAAEIVPPRAVLDFIALQAFFLARRGSALFTAQLVTVCLWQRAKESAGRHSLVVDRLGSKNQDNIWKIIVHWFL